MIFCESETMELKSAVTDSIKKEIVAFANSAGGTLCIGVADDGTPVGLDDPDGAALTVSNMARDAIKPDVTMFLHYETIEEAGKRIVAIQVQRGSQRPYYIASKGLRPEGVFVRQGYSSVPASETAIRSMIKETDGERFEEMRSLEQELTFEAAKTEFDARGIAFETAHMKTLGLMTTDGIYTNLGLLLSDQCVHTVKAAVFSGVTQNEFMDRDEFGGSLLRQANEVYAFIDRHNRRAATFEGLLRIDRRDYPETAVREALLNMLVHREYAIRASSLVSIYEDRIEFTSVGGLVGGVTLDDVMLGLSVCRNAKLANVFYRLALIEAYGTGLAKIMNAYADSPKKPKIEATDNGFKIVLPNMNSAAQDQRGDETQEQIVLELIRKKGEAARRDVEEALSISQTASGRLLKDMIERGQIVRQGSGKGTRYRIKAK